MSVLFGLGFALGGICVFGHYVRSLWKGEFAGGRRRHYSPIYRDAEPVRFWLCAIIFAPGALAAPILGTGIGVATIAANLDLHKVFGSSQEPVSMGVVTESELEHSAAVRR
ncbi:MAG: hypothetical protein KDB01_23050 [Planctomycetaceae bacterium]|nr:hypothetical protein [Planctomycetaceae bacterium]